MVGWMEADECVFDGVEWETLKKIVTKSEPVFGKIGIPIFLTSFLLEMEDRVNEMSADKAFKKSTSPTNAILSAVQWNVTWPGV